MSTEQQVIQRSQLLNRRVIDRTTAEEIGRLDDLWLDPKTHQVLGFTCKSGFLGRQKHAFTWAQIHTIGTDSILVNVNPETEDPQKPEQAVNVMGHEVLTDSGNTVGQLADYILAAQSGTVVGYLYKSSGWRGVVDGTYLLSPEDISSVGSKRVIVIDSAVQEPQQYTEGMNQRLNQMGEFLKDDYDKSMRDLRTLIRGGQTFAEQAKDRAQEMGEQAQERARILAEQARDRAQEVAEQTRERVAQMKPQEKAAALPGEPEILVEPTPGEPETLVESTVESAPGEPQPEQQEHL